MNSVRQRTILVTSILVILVMWRVGPDARAQSDDRPNSALSLAAAAQQAASPTPTPTCSPPDKSLKLVVALFRHGVRAPLKEFGANAGKHSSRPWPKLNDWGLSDDDWGVLTPHGTTAVKVLGAYYGSYYSCVFGNGFKAYLWADSQDQRTVATADALSKGMESVGINALVDYVKPAGTTDPLFHPFTANCGTPSQDKLNGIVADIKARCPEWLDSFKDQLSELDQDV